MKANYPKIMHENKPEIEQTKVNFRTARLQLPTMCGIWNFLRERDRNTFAPGNLLSLFSIDNVFYSILNKSDWKVIIKF